jgi:DNA-binding transcriptional LysR family regulator
MSLPDLNLLVALDALLAEGSVTRAAERLRLSPSATSRALTRLRTVTGDPLLVRAGRGLVPTPRAIQLRDEAARLVAEAEAMLRPAAEPDVRALDRTFTLRASDGFVENFGPVLIRRLAVEAPGVRLRFVLRSDRESEPLRGAAIDLDIGVVGAGTGPEIRVRRLFGDRFVGVARRGHALCEGDVTPSRFAAAGHVLVSRRGLGRGLVDDALEGVGLSRRVAVVVTGFAGALSLVRATDLVASVPERQTGRLRDGLFSFPLPVEVPQVTVSLLWHPRQEADAAHRWFRDLVREVVAG